MERSRKKTVGDRLRLLLKAKGFSQIDLSRQLKISHQSISSAVNGKHLLSTENIIRLIDLFPDLNVLWLYTGEGAMLKGSNGTVSESETPLYKRSLTHTESLDHLKSLGQEIILLEEQNATLRAQITDKERIIRLMEPS